MTIDSDIVTFMGVAIVVVITPGPDIVLVTTHALARGRSAARLAALGVCSGILVHAAAAAIGLSALLATSSLALSLVKWVGGVFLVGLGVRVVWNARRTPSQATEPRSPVPMLTRPRRLRLSSSPFWQGFWSNVLNPKVAFLFLSLLPQFVDPGEAALEQTLVLSAAFLAMGLVWLLVYATVVSRAAGFLRDDRVRRWIDVVSGSVLVALGLRIAVEDS